MHLRRMHLVPATLLAVVVLAATAGAAVQEPPATTTHVRVTVQGNVQGAYTFFARAFEVKGVASGNSGAHEYTPFLIGGRGVDRGGSDKIIRSFAMGEELESVTIDVLDANAAVVWSYRLGDAFVLSVEHGTGAAMTLEEVEFGFERIDYIFGTDVISDRSQRQTKSASR